MANVKIDDLTNAGTLTDTMQFEVDTAGTTSNKVVATVVKTYMQAGLSLDTHDHDSDYAALGHNHDSDYSDILHNHDLDYSSITHNHDSDYAALSHNHAASEVNSGTFSDARIAESNVTQHVAALAHDSLSGFVSNEHINHTGVTLNAGTGLSGGGDISANRTFNLDLHSITLETAPTSSDEFPFYDVTAGVIRICEGQYLSLVHNHDSDYAAVGHNHDSDYAALVHNHDADYADISHNHDATYAALSHTHATTDITSGTFADARVAASNVTQHEASIDHDALTNFVAAEHVSHSGVTLTAGVGITGGGTIEANRTFDLDTSGITEETTPLSTDSIPFYDDSASAMRRCDLSQLASTHTHDYSSTYAPLLFTETSEHTTSYTMVLGDAFKVVWMNGTSLTLTVPTNASVAYSTGTIIGIYNSNSTTLTIAGDTGVTVRNAGTIPQYSEASLRKRGTNEWVLVGDIT